MILILLALKYLYLHWYLCAVVNKMCCHGCMSCEWLLKYDNIIQNKMLTVSINSTIPCNYTVHLLYKHERIVVIITWHVSMTTHVASSPVLDCCLRISDNSFSNSIKTYLIEYINTATTVFTPHKTDYENNHFFKDVKDFRSLVSFRSRLWHLSDWSGTWVISWS